MVVQLYVAHLSKKICQFHVSALHYAAKHDMLFFQEMNLLAEVDQPGSLIDNYVAQLSFLLSRKASGLVSLQARLARFQQRLKEQEILSRQKPLR
jgi:hypothetical protein